MTYVITEARIGTKARNCVEVCPEDEVPEGMRSYIARAAGFDYSGVEPG